MRPRQSHCCRGHLYSPHNTSIYQTSRGLKRICKACRALREAAYRKGEPPPLHRREAEERP